MKTKNKSQSTIEKRFDTIEEKLSKIDGKIDLTKKIIRVEIAVNGLQLKRELMEEMRKLNNTQLDKLDYIVKELEEMREDRTIGAYQTTELGKRVDNHEKRIIHLEKARQTP